MAYLYRRMRGRGLSSLFWTKQGAEPSLYEFMSYYNPSQGNLLMVIEHTPVGTSPYVVGIFALTDFSGTHKCALSIWLEPRVRGVNSHLIGKQVITHCHTQLQVENLFAFTPWRHAQEYCVRVGLDEVAEIPSFCKWRGRDMDVYVFHSEKERWRQVLQQDLINSGWQVNTAAKIVADIYGEAKMRNDATEG